MDLIGTFQTPPSLQERIEALEAQTDRLRAEVDILETELTIARTRIDGVEVALSAENG